MSDWRRDQKYNPSSGVEPRWEIKPMTEWQTSHSMMRGYRAAQMLLTGQQGGILGHLVDAPRPADELADLIGVHTADIQNCEGPSQSWKSWPKR